MVVVIGRPVHIMAGIASLHLRYKIYTYVLYLKLLLIHASTLMWWKTMCSSTYLGAQPSLVSIIASYKQTSKSLPGTSLPTSMKLPNKQYAWQFKFANTVPTVAWTSNDLIYNYMSLVFTFACGQKCDVTCHVKFTTIHGNCMNTMWCTIFW